MNKKTPPQQQYLDQVQGFVLKRSGIRGRAVRLGPAIDAIIKRHEYPKDVGQLLAETMALTVALAFALKYEGVFTLQTRGDGPVDMLVCDIERNGAMRGYAQFDEDKVKKAKVGGALLLGKGHLAFTVDSGNTNNDRYQGIVELVGRSMADCVQNYFRQSEQIDTTFKVFAEKDKKGHWDAGVIMLQRLPHQGGYAANNNFQDGVKEAEEHAEDWNRSKALLETLTQKELLDAKLSTDEILHRLFHEEQLEADAPVVLRDQCRCSRQRVAMVLSTLPADEMEEILKEGVIEVKCEFCSTAYEFDAEQIKQIEPGPGVR